VLLLLNHEYAYKNDSDLPNSNPKCPQLLVVPNVFKIQTAAIEIVKGLNLNKCCPVHDDDEV
jgi:hypothetical protein